MQINRELKEQYSIEGYSESEIKIAGEIYQKNLLVCNDKLIHPWQFEDKKSLTADDFAEIYAFKPEVIILGYAKAIQAIPQQLQYELAKRHIGLEYMSLGAACRTFNILLSEQRNVVLGVIF